MKPRSKKATKEELERYVRLKELGCIVTRLKRGVWAYPEIHHMTSGGRRLGNDKTIPLTDWYHRGVIPADCKTSSEATSKYGPSMAKDKLEFECVFGGEEYLLAETNKLLSSLEHPDWLQIPKFLRRGDD